MSLRPHPPTHGVVADPPSREWPELARRPRARGGDRDWDLDRWRVDARDQALAVARTAAVDHRASAPPPELASRPWLVTGHQPALVHPGIWTRFLLLDALALGGDIAGFELVVDTDVGDDSVLAVPRVDGEPRIVRAEIAGADDSVGASRPAPAHHRVAAACAEAITAARTLPEAERRVAALVRFRDRAVELAATSRSFPAWVVASRRAHERDTAPTTAVLPVTRLAATPAFRRFVALIVRDAARFGDAHEATLASFRARERIRSGAHPAPALRTRGEDREVPLWVLVGPRRVPLFVSPSREIVADGVARVRLPPDLDEAAFVLARSDLVVVPRATTLTAYVRIFLADLFVHGTGGARYEPFVDQLLAAAFDVQGCPWALATGTLDLGGERGSIDALRTTSAELARCVRHPGAWAVSRASVLPAEIRPAVETLVARRAAQLDRAPGSRSDALVEIDRELAILLRPRREQLEHQVAELSRRAAIESLLAQRTWPFPLFDPAELAALVDAERRA